MNIIFGMYIFLESIFLIAAFFLKEKGIAKLTIWLLVVFSVFLLLNNFDKNIFKSSDLEIIKTKERQQYYSNELGKLYRNRLGILYFNNLRLYESKVEENLFTNLDFNSYFSFSEMRYPLIFAPIFITGFLFLLINMPRMPIIYLGIAFLASAFIRVEGGPILIYPVINLCIAVGALKLFNFSRSKMSKT